jgi:hypothetical protein
MPALFYLAIAPVTAATLTAAEAGTDRLSGVEELLLQGGVGAIMIVIWYFTFRTGAAQQQESLERINDLTKLLLDQAREATAQLVEVVREDNRHKAAINDTLNELRHEIRMHATEHKRKHDE